jgi:hypothetical protein
VLDRTIQAIGRVFVGLQAGQGGLDLVYRGRLAQVVGDVDQVAVGAGEVAFENVGTKQLGVAGLDGVEEVAEMVAVACELPDQLLARALLWPLSLLLVGSQQATGRQGGGHRGGQDRVLEELPSGTRGHRNHS